jgi:hypothetical protein
MTTATQDELYTAVQNMTGGEHVFSYLGPRGMRLGADEVVLIPGDLVSTLGALTQAGQRRKFDGLKASLEAGRLRINSRPAPVLYDATAEAPVSLAVVSGVLGTVVPTYEEDASDSYAAV